jgi:DNA-binding XRE family transcriptional regulator
MANITEVKTGKRMRELRRLVGLRQIEVAPELGINNETICRWERQEHKDLLKVYAEAFERLIRDPERVAAIKARRPLRRNCGFFKRPASQDRSAGPVSSGKTIELTSGDSAIRVLMPTWTTKEDTLQILRQLIAKIEGGALNVSMSNRGMASDQTAMHSRA